MPIHIQGTRYNLLQLSNPQPRGTVTLRREDHIAHLHEEFIGRARTVSMNCYEIVHSFIGGFLRGLDSFQDTHECSDGIYKSEFESAAREAFVAVEKYLKKKSGLDSHGFDLATRALSFEIDKQTGEIKRAPLIAINDLKNESERNEQDGIRYMLMGFFQGPRNLYQHNHIGSGVSNSISVIIEASFFLHLLDGHSITQNGRWIPVKADYREIYQKIPKRIDRWKLVRLLEKRTRRLKNNP